MPIQPINFPMLTSQQNRPMSTGINNALDQRKSYNDILTNLLAQKKAQAELPYAAPLSAANVMSKTAYAKWAPIQPLAQLLSNPAVWSSLPKDQLQNMTSILSRALESPAAYTQLMSQGGMPSNQAGNITPSTNGNLLTSLINKNSPQIQQQPSEGNSDISNGTPGLPPTNFNRNAPGFVMPGSSGGANPSAYSKAQEAGLTTSSIGEAAAHQEMFKNMFKDAYETGDEAQNNINYLDKFDDAYNKLSPYERGPLAGRFPAITTNAQDADSAARNLAAAVVRSQQVGHITVSDRDAYEKMKTGRFMTPEAKDHTVNFMKGMNQRIQERLPFLVAAQKVTYKGQKLSPPEINSIWLEYAKQKPFYNKETGQINSKNLDEWENFLTPSKIDQALSPANKKEKSGYEIELERQLKNPDITKQTKSAISRDANKFKNETIHMVSPSGEEYDVPQGKAQLFIKNGYKRK